MFHHSLSSRVLLVVLLALAMVTVNACQSSSDSSETNGDAEAKPIDRVRAGIISVRDQLQVTLVSAQAASARGKPQDEFARQLSSTRAAADRLRNDAAELRERADDYLRLWSGQSAHVSGGKEITVYTDERRSQREDKYNEMVASLLQARDEFNPLMTDLENLQGRFDDPTLQQARARGQRITQHLDTAVARLDELKAMFEKTSITPSS